MKKVSICLLICMMWASASLAQPFDQIVKIMPLFASWTNVKAVDKTLTIGVFSELGTNDDATVKKVKESEYWNRDVIKEFIGHQQVETVPLTVDNLMDFQGQIIWVLDADQALPLLMEKSQAGIFTIGVQNQSFEDFLVATLIYENVSADPKVERWKLLRFVGNCGITPLEFSYKLTTRDNFVGQSCPNN